MDRNSVSIGRYLTSIIVLIVPIWLVMGTLVMLDLLSPMAALGAVGVLTLVLCFAIYRLLDDWLAVTRWARTLAQGANASALKPRESVFTSDPMAAVGIVWRAWQRERDGMSKTAEWHRDLFFALPDPLILLGEDRRITQLNQAARQTFGRDVVGRNLSVILRTPEILEAADAILNGERFREIEITQPVPVERTFLARLLALDSIAEDGTCAILSLHDITSIRRVEQMRADFVANASHELRTPLSTLLGFIETLRGPAHDDADARDRFLAIMQDQATRMARLVQDLLSLSRIELNEHSPPQDRVDLPKLVTRAVEAMAPLAQQRRMTMVPMINPDLGCVLGQPDELIQVVQNLLDNAVKYGREGTEVTIRMELAAKLPTAAAHLPLGQTVIIAISDHSDGIPREHLPRLTERFYRVDTARSRSLGGTGLGLAIVKHIVNRHRGVLTIDSTPGEGSVFSIYLPLVSIQAAPLAPRQLAG